MQIITFLTDFGTNNGYVAQMKGVAASETYARLIDITHNITPQNIRQGAFILQTTAPYYPPGTIHIAVVDPGVGTDRRGIVVTTRTQVLIGPDNGLLIPAARTLGDFAVYEIKNPKYTSKLISNTFHGRDIFTPVACHIINEIPFDEIGPIINDYMDLDFGKTDVTDKTATGKVIYIDSFGDIITNIDGNKLKHVVEFDKKIMVFIGKKQQKMSFVKTYDMVKKGEILATIGSSNHLEISMNQGNAAKKLGIKPDDDVKILFS